MAQEGGQTRNGWWSSFTPASIIQIIIMVTGIVVFAIKIDARVQWLERQQLKTDAILTNHLDWAAGRALDLEILREQLRHHNSMEKP